jgi:hypothetical protein
MGFFLCFLHLQTGCHSRIFLGFGAVPGDRMQACNQRECMIPINPWWSVSREWDGIGRCTLCAMACPSRPGDPVGHPDISIVEKRAMYDQVDGSGVVLTGFCFAKSDPTPSTTFVFPARFSCKPI